MSLYRHTSAVVLLAVCGTVAAQDITFYARTISDTNTKLRSMSAGDLDGDGDIDILAANCDDNEFAWYENLGGNPIRWEKHLFNDRGRRQPCHCRMTDLDGDGDNDFIGVAIVEGSIMMYENDGQSPPNFTPRILYTDPDGFAFPPYNQNGPEFGLTGGIRQIAFGDVDGDGDIDLASAAVNLDYVAWFENDGNSPPSFTPHLLDDDMDGARTVHISDLNGDGLLDIQAGGWYDSRVISYENQGTAEPGVIPPTFSERIVYQDPDDFTLNSWRLFAEDIDLDGDLDLFNAQARGPLNANKDRYVEGWAEWYENNGGTDPTFTRRTLAVQSQNYISKSIFVKDLNNDGFPDPIIGSAADDRVNWFENNGQQPAAFTTHTLTIDPDSWGGNGANPRQGLADYARAVWAADLDNDGDNDIIWAAREANRIGYHENGLINPPCRADVTTTNSNPGEEGFGQRDGVVDGADIAYVVERWVALDNVNADFTTTNTSPTEAAFDWPDGQVDGADLSWYIEEWLSVTGLPDCGR